MGSNKDIKPISDEEIGYIMCPTYNMLRMMARIDAEKARAGQCMEILGTIKARLTFDEPWTETKRRIEELIAGAVQIGCTDTTPRERAQSIRDHNDLFVEAMEQAAKDAADPQQRRITALRRLAESCLANAIGDVPDIYEDCQAHLQIVLVQADTMKYGPDGWCWDVCIGGDDESLRSGVDKSLHGAVDAAREAMKDVAGEVASWAGDEG